MQAETFPPGFEPIKPTINGSAAPKRALRLVLFRDIEAEPRKECIVERLLGAGEASGFAGAPGSGKSVLAGDLACHVAAGLPWLGRRVRQGASIYIAAERAKLTERRFAAFRKHHQIDDLPLALVSGAVDFLSHHRHVDEVAADAIELEKATGWAVALIVVDTVSRVMNGGDENSSKDMGALISNVARLQEATGAHVLLIHHVPQDGNTRLRGHGALLGALDTVVAIEKGSTIRTATVIKDNDGADDQAISFTLKSVSLSIDPDTAQETTAPVVVAADGPSRPPTKNARLPKAAQIALRALHEAVDECGSVPPPSSHIPTSTKTITVDQWRSYAYRLGISTSDVAHAKRTALNRASETLIAACRIGVWDDLVWPVQ